MDYIRTISLIRKIYDGVDLDIEYVKSLVGYHRSYLDEIHKLRERKYLYTD